MMNKEDKTLIITSAKKLKITFGPRTELPYMSFPGPNIYCLS